MIIGIVAIAQNYAIGKEGKLPWHYPADLRHFKETTIGNAVVMGANTWRSLGKPLINRWNIILSRSSIASRPKMCVVARTKDDVFEFAKGLNCDFYIIGGAGTYETFRNEIERWIVTRVPVTIEDADIFMPRDFLEGFVLNEQKDIGDGLVVETFDRRAD